MIMHGPLHSKMNDDQLDLHTINVGLIVNIIVTTDSYGTKYMSAYNFKCQFQNIDSLLVAVFEIKVLFCAPSGRTGS